MPRQRDDEGRYEQNVRDGDLLFFFDAGQRDFYAAGEIAEEFGLDRSQAHRRLAQLAREGELERVQVGNRNIVWWRPRGVVALIEEGSGFSIVDTETGVASQGETRAEALRMLAEAIEVQEGGSEVDPEEVYAELDVDPDQIPDDPTPPWK